MSAGAAIASIGAAFQADPLGSLSLTGPQTEWVSLGSPADVEADGRPLLWLGANQIGKSYAQATKLLHFLRASGPYSRRRPGPVKITIVSISKEQIIPLMEKIWEMLPKTEVKGETVPIECPKARFEPGFGFRGKPPRLVFRSGPAKGSIVTFATYKQGSTRIAGATLDVLMLDEPPPESLWGEVVLRMLRRSGQIWITMTITPESPPQDWLKEKVDSGVVRFLNTRLDLHALTPLDGSPPFLTRAQIAKARRETPAAEIPLRFDAAWSGAIVDRWLSAWGTHCVRTDAPPAGARLLVGVDHSTSIGRQAAVLIACQPGSPGRPQDAKFWILDEVVADPKNPTSTSIQDDARNILAMLARNRLSWEHIDVWLGDRAAIQTTRMQLRKDNAALRRRLADCAGVEINRFPRLEVPYKAGGTVYNGFSELNARMAAPAFGLSVHPRCVGFIRACDLWNGEKKSPHKDILDSVRYCLETALGGKDWHKAVKTNRIIL